MLTIVEYLASVFDLSRSPTQANTCLEDRTGDAFIGERHCCGHSCVSPADDGDGRRRDFWHGGRGDQAEIQVRHAIHNLRIGVSEILCVST